MTTIDGVAGAHPHALLPGFLGEETAARLLAFALAGRERMKPATVGFDANRHLDKTHRRSLVRRDLGDIRALLQARALAVLPSVLPALGMPPFTPREVQVELAAHGDGGFYGPHVDTTLGSPAPPRPRRFTLVYYLHRRPRAFSGGALRLLALNGAFLDVEPAHDLAAAFPSWLPHEVRPVAVPGGDFADSRFSFNIWMLG